jgi:hypothetical protein
LDVLGLDQERNIGRLKRAAGKFASKFHLYSLAPCAGAHASTPERPLRKNLSLQQATNIISAVAFAKSRGHPLVAHLTIHRAFTNAGDDPDGKLFAKLREGLSKWTRRHGFALTCVWSRERMSGGQAEVVHCHLLFYLPVEYRSGARLLQLEAAIYRLIKRHGRDYWAEQVVKLVIHDTPPYPDGKYLIKGGGPQVWKHFRLRKEHRRSQGIIQGKRCGTSQNIGRAARKKALTSVDAAKTREVA